MLLNLFIVDCIMDVKENSYKSKLFLTTIVFISYYTCLRSSIEGWNAANEQKKRVRRAFDIIRSKSLCVVKSLIDEFFNLLN